MKINQDNYEQFFLDHAEGNLSPEMERELSDFLDANPDLKAMLEEFDPSPLQTVDIHNEKLKAKLKKHLNLTDHITQDNVDEWMIKDIEGLLKDPEEKELEEFLSLNPAYRFDYKIFGFTKLSPDLSVVYRRKMELKKKVAHFSTRQLMWLVSAAAAVVLLIIGIRYLSQTEIMPDHPVTPSIAEVPSISSPEITAINKTASLAEKKILANGTSSRVTVSTSRIKPIPTKEITLDNPAQMKLLNLARVNDLPIPAVEKKDRSLIGKVFNNMLAQAREGIDNRPKLEKAGKSDFSFWSIAKAGISGFNSISDREVELYVKKDESGKVKSYALVEDERLIISKNLNKN